MKGQWGTTTLGAILRDKPDNSRRIAGSVVFGRVHWIGVLKGTHK